MSETDVPRVAFARTGVANLASIMAAFRRAGAEPFLAGRAEELSSSPFAVVPGVGAFGSAMEALAASGMDEAIRDRVTRAAPTMGVCAGMQVFFEASEESPGVRGMAIVPGALGRFPPSLPVPQLGWNRVEPRSPQGAVVGAAERSSAGEARNTALNDAERRSTGKARSASPRLVRQGWAYFANSYRLAEAPQGYWPSYAEYGESFVAALEDPVRSLLLCQFHPELSGPWGLSLIERWLGLGGEEKGGALCDRQEP
jgi:Glutamine amidotransferase